MSELADLQDTLNIVFKNPSLLKKALVHRSYLHENPDFDLPSNERLEFLGDSLLSFVIAQKLYEDFPNLSEGGMTKLRAALVRTETLARLARSLGLGNYLYLGRGEETSGGRTKQSILAGVFEAVIGAILIDHGYDACRNFILRLFTDEIGKAADERLIADHKSQLQEITQAKHHTAPIYRTIKEDGPDHAKKFTIEVIVDGRIIATGRGKSKRQAETEAARTALESMDQ
ncbi:MAG: ribonuclease III [Dehalococcoidia bacterium]|nr:ribonuclease III [Dehalococcoidia bacterium]